MSITTTPLILQRLDESKHGQFYRPSTVSQSQPVIRLQSLLLVFPRCSLWTTTTTTTTTTLNYNYTLYNYTFTNFGLKPLLLTLLMVRKNMIEALGGSDWQFVEFRGMNSTNCQVFGLWQCLPMLFLCNFCTCTTNVRQVVVTSIFSQC